MRTARLATACVLTLLGALTPAIPASAQAPSRAGGDADKLEVYVGTLTPEQLDELRSTGVDFEDMAVSTDKSGNSAVETVLSEREAARLVSKGVKLTPKLVNGKTASEALREQAADGWSAYRSYSEPGGLRDEIVSTVARFPKLTKLVTIGKSLQGKPILAVKVTKNAPNVEDGKRPAVLYASTQHAREWITPEMTRRLLHHVLDSYGTNAEITKLVDTTELWFLPVANPDGYDHTFTEGNRLWRKNLRDNDGDGQITTLDGVDPNRNFAYKWGYDNEGSSVDFASDTFRGTGPNSEPETQALDRLFRRIGFEFFVNYHSAAELILYGIGWQQSTPSPDDEIYKALAGDDANPAVPGYDPDLSAELYITNGDTDTHATVRYGTLGFTPEMTTCEVASASVPDDEWEPEDCVSSFIFPDDEDLIAAEVAKNIPFALAVAKSTHDPDEPVSVVGRTTPDFVVDAFDVSYGRSQQVASIVRRALTDVRMHYTINGGAPKTVGVKEWKGGERYGDTHDDYFAEMRGKVTGAKPGDRVEVWFTGRKAKVGPVASTRFTYTVNADIGGDVLVLAAEDVTGLSPAQNATSAKYADEHVAALTAAGYTSDVYDFDTQGREAPHHLGVLSHYKAVVWETGDDVIQRSPGQVPGTTTKAALDTELAVRDYLNEGGKLLVGGQNALFAQAANGAYFYNPGAPPECTNPDDPICLPLVNDFQQYYLGAHTYVSGVGTDAEGSHYPLSGRDALSGWTGQLNAAGSAGNQTHTASFLPTSSFLPPDQFPQFTSSIAADWLRPGAAPFDPLTGAWYLYSGQSDQSYKRLTRTVDLTGATSGELRFSTSYDTEAEWDFIVVEAHEVGTDNWTTLPDANGHTTTDPGTSCERGWVELHPFTAHYQTQSGDTCTATGTTGSWNAASGASGGWQEWAVDLSAYAGKRVELSISYISDWATQGIGVFVDDVRVTVGGAAPAETSFEADLGGWTVAGPAPGSAPNSSDWLRTQTAFDEGGVVVTEDTVYTGFGLEGLTPEARNDLVARSMTHLLG